MAPEWLLLALVLRRFADESGTFLALAVHARGDSLGLLSPRNNLQILVFDQRLAGRVGSGVPFGPQAFQVRR